MTRILLIGYGNPGRLDDGLGPALVRRIGDLGVPGITTEEVYQLQVEDSLEVACSDVTIFLDASIAQDAPFAFTAVEPDPEPSFTTHSVTPGAIVSLAIRVHDAQPDAYLLAIRGHDFNGFGEKLSTTAVEDLEAALAFITPLLHAGDPNLFRAAVGAPTKPASNGALHG